MALPTQPYKGTRDFYPEDKRIQKWMFAKLRDVVESFGYLEYDGPMLEPFEIFAAKTGEEIVHNQLYSFEDRGGRKVAIRPEMTPTVSRMVAARRQELAYPLRWYSIPNLWRYERPQRGRVREHWQLNIDIFGIAGIEADFEIIQVADAIMQAFSASRENYVVRINSRKLVDFVMRQQLGLSSEKTSELAKLIDHRDKITAEEFVAEAEDLIPGKTELLSAFLTSSELDGLPADVQAQPSYAELNQLFKLLTKAKITNAVFEPSVMRGMDYYTDIVFEVYDNNPDNNRSMFGGGRYDDLVSLFGVDSVPTVGFGMGDVTLQNFLETNGLIPQLKPEVDAVVILIGEVFEAAQPLIEQLRISELKLAVDPTDRKLDAKIKSAAKAGVNFVIFIGDKEIASGRLRIKNLQTGEEKETSPDEIKQIVKNADQQN